MTPFVRPAIAGNQLQLTTSAIPEPSTYAAILSAASLLAALRRRRRIFRSGEKPEN